VTLSVSLEGLQLGDSEPHVVSHDIALDLATVHEIAARHTGHVEAHQAALPLVHASGHRRTIRAAPSTTVAELADNDSWVTLSLVNDDEAMRPIAAALTAQLGAMGRPDATFGLSLVCSSAHGITPAHMDVHDVLLLQLIGPKTFSTGSIPDRRERESELRRRFGNRENLSRLPDVRREWALGPGVGAYLPAYTPHWAEVGDEVSIALSVVISTPGLRHREAIHRADAALVRHGLRLPAPGRSRALDETRLQAVRLAERLPRRRVREADPDRVGVR